MANFPSTPHSQASCRGSIRVRAVFTAISIATAFTFNACGDDGNNSDKYAYCVFMEQQICLSGSFETCANGGTPSNNCPTGYDNSSLIETHSSSGIDSGKNSSSSVEERYGDGDSSSSENIKWDSDNGGTLEIVNTSSKDMVIFYGQIPTKNNIMGGVRAGTTKTFDVSNHFSDFSAGGWTVLRGITREEYNANEFDLSEAKVEFNAFAAYRAGEKYRVVIDYNFMGDYAFRVSNRGRLGLELRANSPEGEKVAYLPPLQVNQMIYTQTTDAVTLFPHYVFYDKSTQTITKLRGMYESVAVSPRLVSNTSGIQTYIFPSDETMSWDIIVGTLKSPFAYITVTNNVINQGAYIMVGSGNRLYSQSGYDAIGSGEQLVFEVEATEEGVQKSLMAVVYGGLINIPILFEGETTPPVIENGYDYTVIISGSGLDVSGYAATIIKGQKRDISGLL